jgi:hypothetical protein
LDRGHRGYYHQSILSLFVLPDEFGELKVLFDSTIVFMLNASSS